jgi:twitching motility protein PilJ
MNITNETVEQSQLTDRKRGGGINTLRNRLLLTVLPTVLIPLTLVTAIEFNLTLQKETESKFRLLKDNSQITSDASRDFLKQSLKIPDLLAHSPIISDALKAGTKIVAEKKLAQQDIQKTEAEFKATKLIQSNPSVNQYLATALKDANFAEILLTERNGFNAAFSNTPSDFVQSDEKWWQYAKAKGRVIGSPEFDDSAKALVIALSQAVKAPGSGEFQGVIKTAIPVTNLSENLSSYLAASLVGSKAVQTVDTGSGKTINTISAKGSTAEQQEVLGGQTLIKASQALVKFFNNPSMTSEQLRQDLTAGGMTNIIVERVETQDGQKEAKASLEYQGKIFSLTTIPTTEWVAIASVDRVDIYAPGQELLGNFALTFLLLGGIAVASVLLLARQLSTPLGDLTESAQKVAEGDLTIKAEIAGTSEVQTLAQTFNDLVTKVNALLDEQKQQREALETAIFQLVNDVEGAMDGDLTVRARLDSMEMSTVADIFNAIIDNLRDIAIQVRESAVQVNSSLETNEQSVRLLSEKAVSEAAEIRSTLGSVEQMSESIQTVASSANEASKIADLAYTNVQQGSAVMVQTVDSILNLRNTVGETAKKMKRLGESSQKISQVVALIEEIALKTNLLAINASVEASRAGEQGQGFTVVAEQVGALAEQSAAATREIAQIVAAIQSETQDVAAVMEVGTSQVVDSTRLVESTKERLIQVLEESQKINDLMKSISTATVSQTETARVVSELMKQVTASSEERSDFSIEMAISIQETSEVAKKLEEKVAQFQV